MDLAARIAQFENMAQADPDNEMAHFSLGNAYMQAGRYSDAAQSYMRCVTLSPGMSKAYQLAGEAYLKAGSNDQAALVLEKGYTTAVERGDRMPQSTIAEMLRSLGKELPKVTARGGSSGSGDVSLLGGGGKRAGMDLGETRMDRPPFKGPLGAWIAANISKEKWEAWIRQGTKVINELRLDLSREQDSAVYDQHMREYLGVDDELFEKIMSTTK